MSEITPDIVRRLFDYSEGVLIWRERPMSDFLIEKHWRISQARFSGKIAGSVNHCRSGTRRKILIAFKGTQKKFLASRLIWAWHNGSWPVGLIDHEDGDTENDRIENLRDVSSAANSKNMRMHPSNKSGVTGVVWSDRLEKWVVGIMANRKSEYLGVFSTLEEATAVRKAAEVKYGFHKNHGRPSNV